MDDFWQPPPSMLMLAPQVLHIWSVNIAGWSEADLNDGYATLSQAEQRRADRIVVPEAQVQFIASHVALRYIINRYIHCCQPRDFSFILGKYGKPALQLPEGAMPLTFNMSHSQAQALYVIAKDVEVGIDVEHQVDTRNYLQIAKRFFSSQEWRALMDVSKAKQLSAFYRCWTRKEAYIKLLGKGLSLPLASFTVSIESGGVDNLIAVADPALPSSNITLGDVPVLGNYVASYAAQQVVNSVHFYTWSPVDKESFTKTEKI